MSVPPGDDDELAAALAKLTPAQQRRVIAHASGESKTSIAKREGVSVQAVDQSLRSPAIDNVYSIAGHRLVTRGLRRGASGELPIVDALFQNLVEIALEATRPVVHGGSYTLVPDHALRFDATVKILELIRPADCPPVQSGVQSPHEGGSSEVVAREKTTVTRSREIRRKG
jgi:hypothetical protein